MIAQQALLQTRANEGNRSRRVHNVRVAQKTFLKTALISFLDEFKSVIVDRDQKCVNLAPAAENTFTVFEDPKLTKIYYEKCIAVRIVLVSILIVNSILGLVIYDKNRMAYNAVTNQLLVISFFCSALQFIAALLWPLVVYFEGLLKREKLLLSEFVGIFSEYGIPRLALHSLLLLFHPFYVFLDLDFPVKDSYFTSHGTFETFKRPTSEYLTILQITISLVHIASTIIVADRIGNTRSDRIARFFSIKADATYIVRAAMQNHPFSFTCFM